MILLQAVGSVITDAARALASMFDWVAYSLINYCYKILLYLSNIDLSGFGGVSTLVSRIYILLGIFMLFKLAFSIIQYVVAPDSFTDSGKGFGKLATNVMVSMALLVATPWLFSMLYEAQGYILQENIIGRLVMGANIATEDDTKLSVDKISSMANDTEFLLYGAFASINTNLDGLTKCQVKNGDDVTAQANIMGSTQQITINGGECLDALEKAFKEDPLQSSDINLYDFFKYVGDDGKIKDDRDFAAFGKMINWQKDSTYVVNYIPFISTIVGGYVAFLLIFYCIDVALRAVKLLFLQIVAPISIISYIDPKESISNSKLSNWLKEVFSTWASLFIRLLVIFLVMQLISIIATGVLGNGTMINNKSINFGDAGAPDGVTQMFIYVFLVIGCFQFAKKVPELIEKLFGIKMSGELRIGQTLGSFTGGLVGGAIGSASGLAGAFAASRDNELGAGKTMLNMARGFASGGMRSMISAGKAGDKGVGTWAKTGMSAAGRQSRAVDIRGTTKPLDRVGARVRNAIGMQSKKESLDSRLGVYDNVKSKIDAMEDRAKDQLGKKDDNWKLVQIQREKLQQDYKNGVASAELTNMEAAEAQYRKQKGIAVGPLQQEDMDYIKKHQTDLAYQNCLQSFKDSEDKMVQEYIDRGGITENSDADLGSMKDEVNRIVDENKITVNGKTIKKDDKNIKWDTYGEFKDYAKDNARNLRTSDEYENATKVEQYIKSSVGQKHMNS